MSKPLEKGVDEQVEYTGGTERIAFEIGDDINEKAVIRKIDYRLVPWLALLYLLSFLDRTNIGNANLFGLSANLGLSDSQYSACLAVFFAFYVLFEVPSNMVLKAWRPSMWIPIIMIAWGGVMIGMGFVRNYTDLLITRIFLGITEAGLFPGVSYYLTQWYRRYEISFRISLFFSAATAAGAFGGLLARLINEMDGIAGYEGWRWIFIIEGILTVVVSVASFWMMYDYPDTAKFLSDSERVFVVNRLKLDNDGLSHAFKYKFVKDAFFDWKIWAFAVIYIGVLMPLYCFSLFSPTLTANLGYSAAKAQLLSVPPYVLASITTIIGGWASDRLQQRSYLIIGFGCLGALGYVLLISNQVPAVNYLGIHLAAAGVYPLIPLTIAWQANNIGGSLKKGVATAIIISFGNAGGCISSFAYPRADRPKYTKGHAINIAFLAIVIFGTAGMMIYLKRENKRKLAVLEARGGAFTAEEMEAREDEGESVEWFKYTL